MFVSRCLYLINDDSHKDWQNQLEMMFFVLTLPSHFLNLLHMHSELQGVATRFPMS